MVFNATYTERRRRTLAMTLVEMMVSMAIGGIILSAVASLSWYTGRSFAAVANYAELDAQSRKALDYMSQKIRQADAVTYYSASEIRMSYDYGATTLTYKYDSGARTLTETVYGRSTVLLKEADALNFQMFSRVPVYGQFSQFPVTTDAAAGKLIQVSWTCSRTILGNKVNTESIQSAKIVIRKQ